MAASLRKIACLLALAGALAACSSDKDDKIQGDRIAVLKPAQALQVDSALKDTPLDLPEPYINSSWGEVMGAVDGSLGNLALNRTPQRVWSRSIGAGGTDDRHLLSRPVALGDRVFTLDADAEVRAFTLADGESLWSRNLTPESYDERQFGGGVAASGDRVFVTTGFGTVAALNAANGEIVWQKDLKTILRGAPAVAGERLFVTTDDGQTYALATTDGAQQWVHSGITEPATLLGEATPVVADEVAYIPYNSGELYAVRVQNGRTLWQQTLTGVRRQGGTLEAISTIAGSPAIDGKRVYAVSNSGRTVAVDRRTGNMAWDLDIGGNDTPIIAGDLLAILQTQNMLVLLDRSSGRVRATYPLPSFKDDDKKHPIYWSGPVMADGILWVTGSNGQLRGIDAKTGEQTFKTDLPDKAWLAPIVVDKTLLVLTMDGRLSAYR